MTHPIATAALARILAASACDIGDERDVIRSLREAGCAESAIPIVMDEVIERARVIRQQDIGLVHEVDTATALANGDCR